MTGLPGTARNAGAVLVCGDLHGNRAWVSVLTRVAEATGCELLVQLGDLGFFPDRPAGVEFLAHLEAELAERHLTMVFIDGNHDHHPELAKLASTSDGFGLVSPHVLHAPRGHRFELGGVRVGALGGAVSVDRSVGAPGVRWFPEEAITPDDVAALGSDQLDVLLCHDVPAGVPLHAHLRVEPFVELLCAEQRRFLVEAVEATRPSLVLHGHWHQRHSSILEVLDRAGTEASGEMIYRSVRVAGLSRDGSISGVCAVLDLATLELTTPVVELEAAVAEVEALLAR